MEEKDKLLAQLETVRNRMSGKAFNGIQNAIEEYYGLQDDKISSEGYSFGKNPVEFYDYLKGDKKGYVDSRRYIDMENTDQAQLSTDDLYRMFSRQVVDSFKKGKFIEFPSSGLNLGMYYRPVGHVTNSYTFSTGANVDMDEIRKKANQGYTSAIQDRLDYFINNAKDNDLYDAFNAGTIGQYDNKLSDMEFFRMSVENPRVLAGQKTADTFNKLLNRMARGGRKIGNDTYFDANMIPINVKGYTPSGADQSSELYQQGVMAAKLRQTDKDLGNYMLSEYGKLKNKGKGDEFSKQFKAGFWDEVAKNSNVFTRTDTNEPAVFGRIGVNANNGIYDVTVGDRSIQMNDVNAPQQLKDYAGKLKFWRNIIGEQNDDSDLLVGGGFSPL